MLKEIYEQYKTNYKNYVLLIKSGNFYISMNNDAIIMSNILKYKIKESSNFIKTGFPISSLSKVINILHIKEINYLVIDKEIITKEKFDTNNYDEYLNNNYRFYLNRINNITKILKDNINNKQMNIVLTEMENTICKIN